MIVYAFSFVFPFLLAYALLQLAVRPLRGKTGPRARQAIAAFAAAVVCLVPVGGVPLARVIVGVNANFSVLLTALLLARVWKEAGGRRLLDERALSAARWFALAAGVALYPMALGLGPYDPYALGWEFSPLFAAVLAVTVALLVKRNRFGAVLVACILAYDLGLLESPNLWDYLVDPFAAVWALAPGRGVAAVGRRMFAAALGRLRRGEAGTEPAQTSPRPGP